MKATSARQGDRVIGGNHPAGFRAPSPSNGASPQLGEVRVAFPDQPQQTIGEDRGGFAGVCRVAAVAAVAWVLLLALALLALSAVVRPGPVAPPPPAPQEAVAPGFHEIDSRPARRGIAITQ
jgi:hypothetical protein